MSPADAMVSEAECRLNAGWPPVVRVSGAGPAGRSPGGLVPPQPRAAGVPGSSDTHRKERLSRIISGVLRACEARSVEQQRQARREAALDAQLSEIDFGKIHSDFRNPIFDIYPPSLRNHLKRDYLSKAGTTRRVLFGDARWTAVDAGLPTNSWQAADRWLATEDAQLRGSKADIAFDEDLLESRTRVAAKFCAGLRASYPAPISLQLALDHAALLGISPPKPSPRASVEGCLNRLCADGWWRRVLRRKYARTAEEAIRARGLVSRTDALYVSHAGFAFRVAQRARNVNALARTIATNDLGESVSLLEIACTNTSAPELRRAELMARIAGIEAGAKAGGRTGIFVVLTLPSRFHSAPIAGRVNERFDGSSPRDGQAWLNKRWQRVRAALGREGIEFSGIRTVEPHHDGTPHWNLLLFAAPEHMQAIRQTIQQHFLLRDSPDEPGAAEHRIREVQLDPARSATAYVAKYVSKNIDGRHVGYDVEDAEQNRDASETCARVDAWASIHGIRQFQFFGTPPVGSWRELRRLKEPQVGVLELARVAADKGLWADFTAAVSIPTADCDRRWSIGLLKGWSDKPGKYGDPLGEVVLGVCSGTDRAYTRLRVWRINWNALPPSTCVH
jgi:hypothetical protein